MNQQHVTTSNLEPGTIHELRPDIAQGETKPFWLNEACITGSLDSVKDGEILVIGSGLSGVSTAYWLTESGFNNITLVDYKPQTAATFRNCGHILYGTVESMTALTALHGLEIARKIWDFSVEICHEVRDTILRLEIESDYKQDGYLVIAIEESENQEILESIALLKASGYENQYISKEELAELGFKNVFGARFEPGSAQAHPVKFRNGVIKECLRRGVKYHSNVHIKSVDDIGGRIHVQTTTQPNIKFDAAVICANAYAPLLSNFFKSRNLVEPYRGQILTSKPLRKPFSITYPHSFDHGYEYALMTPDNRLMLGGWRNHTNGETGTYDLTPNSYVENGLKEFAKNHYQIEEQIEWEYSWSGIMAASKTGFPFIGPTNSPLIFCCAGYTGHGFSWAHGSAKLLAKIMAGEATPEVSKYFRPQ